MSDKIRFPDGCVPDCCWSERGGFFHDDECPNRYAKPAPEASAVSAEAAAEKHANEKYPGISANDPSSMQDIKNDFLAGYANGYARAKAEGDVLERVTISQRNEAWHQVEAHAKEITALKQRVAELDLQLSNSDALKDSYLAKLTEAERREREAVENARVYCRSLLRLS